MPIIKEIQYADNFMPQLLSQINQAIQQMKKSGADITDIRISFPFFLTDFLNDYFYKQVLNELPGRLHFFGVSELREHFDQEVVVWHKDGAFLNEPWIVVKISLHQFEV